MDKIIDIIKQKFPTAKYQNQGKLMWVWQENKLMERFDLNYCQYLLDCNELEEYLNNIKEKQQ
jgi:hypothetical protein